VPADKAWEDDMSQYLAQVNVEVINARYVTDLKSFLDNADRYVRAKYGDDIFDERSSKDDAEQDPETKKYKPKISEGAGWVIEVRGWTYHSNGQEFVKKTVLRNFQRIGKFSAETDLTKDKKPKVETFLKGVPDPLKKETMSHPFLLSARKVLNPQPNVFEFINTSEMEGLLAVSAAPAGGSPDGATGGPPRGGVGAPANVGSSDGGAASPAMGAAGGSWVPIVSTATGSSGTPGGTGGGEGTFGGPPAGPLPGAPAPGGLGMGVVAGSGKAGLTPGSTGSPDGAPGGGGPSPQAPGGAGTTTTVSGTKKEKPRTEFVLCFIWREPTPTDPTPAAGGGT
jgi:hypothetical protein